MRTLTFLTAALVIFAAAATAQQKLAPAAAKKLNPCLLTKAEIQQIVSQDVTDPKPNGTNASVCYVTVGAAGTINFMVVQPRPGETPDKFLQEMQKRKYDITEVKGIGDRSFFINQSFGMLQLSTYKGSNNVIITMLLSGAGAAKQKDIESKLMQKALTKL